MSLPFQRKSDSEIILYVRVTPKSAKDAIEGVEARDDGKHYLSVRVRAVPEDGKANRAVEKLVAKLLNIPAGSVSVVSGETSRMKTLSLKGHSVDMEAKLAPLCVQCGK